MFHHITSLHCRRRHVPFFKALLTHLRDGKLFMLWLLPTICAEVLCWIRLCDVHNLWGKLGRQIALSVGNLGWVARKIFWIPQYSSRHLLCNRTLLWLSLLPPPLWDLDMSAFGPSLQNVHACSTIQQARPGKCFHATPVAAFLDLFLN